MRRICLPWTAAAFVLALVTLVPACGPEVTATTAPTATSLNSGISGVVLLGPTCAAQSADASPCLTPYAAARLVVSNDSGETVVEVTSGSDGTFRTALPPGDYVIQPTPGDGGIPSAPPQGVTVGPDEFVQVEIDYDTGIR